MAMLSTDLIAKLSVDMMDLVVTAGDIRVELDALRDALVLAGDSLERDEDGYSKVKHMLDVAMTQVRLAQEVLAGLGGQGQFATSTSTTPATVTPAAVPGHVDLDMDMGTNSM